ncbi:MAG TPA: hypothetical protein VKU19_02150 [Bryobacteraceae bacterium]|nr:hypothetical protein [Bryobacteraceae bacterium]
MTSLARDQLLASVEELAQVTPCSATEVDFAPGANEWNATAERIGGVLRMLMRQAVYSAWVETKSADRVVVCTAVGYGGDRRTVLGSGLPAAVLESHSASVARSVERRTCLLQILLASARTAAALSAASGNPLLLLSAVRNGIALLEVLEHASVLFAPG